MSRFSRSRPVAGVKPVRPLKNVRTHVFEDAGQADHAGEGICNSCGHLRGHRIHNLLVPEGSVEVADRIIGEANA